MPFKVTKDPKSETESFGKTRMEMNKDLKGLTPGVAVHGFVGEPPPEEKPEVKPEYGADDINEMTGIQNLLKKYVSPPALGLKFSAEQCKSRFIRKVERQSLDSLRRFWNKPIPDNGDISPEEQAELQKRWEDLSP